MKYTSLFLTAILLCWSGIAAFSQEITDLSFLRQGGHILFFRHASAPGGLFPNGTGNDTGGGLDTQWWKSCDPATGRQLSTIGRTEALTIGRVMRAQNIRVGRMITSEYCRAYESAMLMNMNTTYQYSSAATMVVYPDAERTVGLRAMVAQAPVAGTNTVVWTHGTNQGEFLFAGLGWSDAAVYRYDATSATSTLIGTIRYPVWARATTSTSVASQQNEPSFQLSISPNPASELLSLMLGEKSDIIVTNALGAEMYSEADVLGTKTLDVRTFPAGTYFVSAGTSTKRVTKKFTKY
jgi:hypothetical protein